MSAGYLFYPGPRPYNSVIVSIGVHTRAAAGLLLAGLWLGSTVAEKPVDPIYLLDLAGERVSPLTQVEPRISVFIFVRADCPISNRYAPELRRITAAFAEQKISFWLIYPDPDTSAETIQAHIREFEYPGRPLRDPDHALVDRTGAEVTPEVAVFNPSGEMVYRGRIDDRYVSFGKYRPEATVHDLEDALTAILGGHEVAHATAPAVGCFISDLK